MSPHAPLIVTLVCGLATLVALAVCAERPAGMRTAFELIDGKIHTRYASNGLKVVPRS